MFIIHICGDFHFRTKRANVLLVVTTSSYIIDRPNQRPLIKRMLVLIIMYALI